MKILHTSDWHLGHTLYNYDRTEEQMSMLRQMAAIVKDRQPDVFLLSGDVFHTSQPSSATQRMFTDAIADIHQACPEMAIVVTAGNHDSATKHEIFSTPWQALNVHVIGHVRRDHPESHLIELPGKGWIIAVPYCYERSIPPHFFQQLIDLALSRDTEELPIVMMAHTTVMGCDFTGHDQATEMTVGGIDSLDIQALGQGYDYLALGHIHHEQWVKGSRHRIRYAGSPLPVSFDESYEHSVSWVEIDHHGDEVTLEKIPIVNPHPLVTLPATRDTWAQGWDEAVQLLTEFPDDIPAYIRLNVAIEELPPVDANTEAMAATEGKACRFCLTHFRRTSRERGEGPQMTVEEFQSEAPIDIARRYAEDCGLTFDAGMDNLFTEVVRRLSDEE